MPGDVRSDAIRRQVWEVALVQSHLPSIAEKVLAESLQFMLNHICMVGTGCVYAD